jgi:hypothetical protein
MGNTPVTCRNRPRSLHMSSTVTEGSLPSRNTGQIQFGLTLPIFAALTVLAVITAALAVALCPVAFRADHAGITLGSERLLPRRPAVFIPWADVETIVVYPGRKAAGFGDYLWASREVEYIGVRRRDGAPPLPRGDEQAPGCPVPGVAAGAARPIKNWGGSTASGWPPSRPRWRRASPSSTPGTTPARKSKHPASARTGTRTASEPS